MTFYEAALRVLESAGRPLHVNEITQQSIHLNLLSHVGKTPEQTMLSRLAAMARRPRDRRVIVSAPDTFALTEWQLPEDTAALALMGQPEVNPEEAQPPLRPAERHPEQRPENVKVAGRGAERHRREEQEDQRRRKRRFPPIPEVVFEILSEARGPLKPEEIAEKARARELASAELSNEHILTALLEDNQRRIDAGRRPQFILQKETGAVGLERAGAPSEAPPLELQAAFAQALGIPLEGGRPVFPRRADAPAMELPPDAVTPSVVRQTAREARRAVARLMRRRLSEVAPGTYEKSCVKMLQGVGFRELKVAKRSKDGPLLTARKREGSVELRYAIRMSRGTNAVDRRAVQELRKDLGHYSAQVGLLLSPGEVRGDARAEAASSGALVLVWCGDALGEKFLEAEAGVTVAQVQVFEIDERFFEVARIDAVEALRRREERHKERELESAAGPGPGSESPAAEAKPEGDFAAPAAAVAPSAPPEMGGGDDEGDDDADGPDEGGDEDDLDAASAYTSGNPGGAAAGPAGAPGGPPGALGLGRKRRRRRRGRRGRGPRPEGSPAPGGGVAASPVSSDAPSAPPPPVPPPSSDGGGNPA